jgi:hypothetical protein
MTRPSRLAWCVITIGLILVTASVAVAQTPSAFTVNNTITGADTADFLVNGVNKVKIDSMGNTSFIGSLTLNGTALAGSSGGSWTFRNTTDNVVGDATTDAFTNKTFDTAGSGNVFKINGTAISAVTGTGSAVLANSPALTGITTIQGYRPSQISRILTQLNNCSSSTPCAVAQFSLAASTSYSFSCDGYWNGDTGGSAAYQFLMAVTNGATTIGGGIRMYSNNAGTSADNYTVGTGTTELTQTATLSSTGNQYEFTVVGNVTTNGNAQTLQLTFNKVTGSGNGIIFVGTQCELFQ